MPSNLPRIYVRLTDDQLASLRALQDKTKLSQNELVRAALKAYAESQGVTWPDDYPQHGGKRETDE